MGKLRPHLSYANVMATVAVFIALGGGAYAAFHLPRNSVRSENIVNGQVKANDLANRAVTSSKLDLPKIDFSGANADANDNAPHHTVLRLDGLTLGLSCAGNEEILFASSTARGVIRGSYTTGEAGKTADTTILAQAPLSRTPTLLAESISSGVATEQFDGVFTFHNARRVITIPIDGVISPSGSSCTLSGTAVPAPN